jgi:L-fucose mutarotase
VLKNVPSLLTPDLLHTLAAMGHGDRLAIVDRNYPSASLAPRVHHLAGADTATAAKAILALFPVDTFDDPAVFRITPPDQPDAWFDAHLEFQTELDAAEGREVRIAPVERLDFYALTRSAYAIVQTGEPRGYSCFVLTKGVLQPD